MSTTPITITALTTFQQNEQRGSKQSAAVLNIKHDDSNCWCSCRYNICEYFYILYFRIYYYIYTTTKNKYTKNVFESIEEREKMKMRENIEKKTY